MSRGWSWLWAAVCSAVVSCSSEPIDEQAAPLCDADFGRACSSAVGCPSLYACYARGATEQAHCAMRCEDGVCPDGLTCDPSLQICLACDGEYEPVSFPDECGTCRSSSECGSKFCNRVTSSDFSDIFGDPLPNAGRCTSPTDSACCITGVLSGSSLCIGTGCPPGERVQICDRFDGREFQ